MGNNNNIVWHEHLVQKKTRIEKYGQKPCLIWFTGLSGSGKSTMANVLEKELFDKGYITYMLDGDNVRHCLNKDLGFSDADREENIRRIGEVARLFVDSGCIVITAFISPFRKERELARRLLEENEFIEVFVDTPLEVCEKRDPKGLYKKARNGEINNFTGIDSTYERPEKPEIVLDTSKMSVEEGLNVLVSFLHKKGYIHGN
ncbi:MAG: adenylyl-sulfate kinase [Deltaproteobacteria bacterium]|nr:adenylyl-sulfate kinase [Deltaproteobacteria bacterium]